MNRKNQRIIHLDDMLYYIFRHWKILLAECVVIGLLFGGIGLYKVQKKYDGGSADSQKKEVSVNGVDLDNVEAVLTLEQAIRSQRNYNKESLLMRVDPNNKKMYSLKYQFHVSGSVDSQLAEIMIEQGKKAYQNVLFDNRLYDNINKELQSEFDIKYIRELIYAETDATGVIVYNITGTDEKMAKSIGTAVKKYLADHNKEILANNSKVNVSLDTEAAATMVDLNLQGVQTNNHANLQNLTTTLDARLIAMSDHAKQYLELGRKAIEDGTYESGQVLYKDISGNSDVSITRKFYEAGLYVVKRIILFLFLAVICLSVKYMWSRTLMYEGDLEDMYGIRVIDVVHGEKSEEIKNAAERIAVIANKNRKILIVGSCISDDFVKVFTNTVKELLAKDEMDVKVIEGATSPKNLKKITDGRDILLIEKIGRSTYNKIYNLLNEMRKYKVNIVGVTVLK